MAENSPSNSGGRGQGRLRALRSAPARLFAWARRNPMAASLASLAILLVVAGGAYAAYSALKRPSDVHNGNKLSFHPQTAKPPVKRTNWPIYGYDPARTRYLAATRVKPPFRKLWEYYGKGLLEFPPIYVDGKLYAFDNDGLVFALDANTGRLLWRRRVAQLNASSPTYSHDRLFVVSLTPGQVLDLNPRNGKTEWRKALPGRSESAPVVVGNRVFFGDEDGTMYAVSRSDGHTIWTTQLCGAIKAAPAYDHGILYAGDYGGCMNAVNSHTGKIKWQSSSQGLSLGRTGEFYSTPAVAFGRVYSGNLDGRVYSFQESDGALAWSHSTGSYVYSGPAVADTPGVGPSVYIGSYDGNVYALDAKTGDTRWTEAAPGPVISSPSAVGNVVYAATYSGTTIVGLDIKNGHRVFTYDTGGGNSPAVSDGHRLFLTGYSSITAFQPLTKQEVQRRAVAKRQREQRHKARQRRRRQTNQGRP